MVAETCVDYFQRYRRPTHVTPKSYLSFIAGYKAIYDGKRSEIGQLARRMNVGLTKLVDATQCVNELSKQLAVKDIELDAATRKADEVLAEVTASAQAAEAVKTQVQKVKDKAQKLVDDIAVRSSSCPLPRQFTHSLSLCVSPSNAFSAFTLLVGRQVEHPACK